MDVRWCCWCCCGDDSNSTLELYCSDYTNSMVEHLRHTADERLPRVRCWGLHSWGKWGDAFVVDLVDGDSVVIGKSIMQQRYCSHCGKYQRKRR